MDPVRLGLAIRALRRRRRWTQAMLGSKAGLSQAAVSRVERGLGGRVTVDTLIRLAAALEARISVRVLSHGEDLDRLLDASHAEIVERTVRLLRAHGWQVVPEATFSVFGERGAIDVLAFHPATGSLLVIEVKSAIPDVQATLSGIDRKVRLAATIAQDRGWRVRSISRWLVVPGDQTTRRRIDRHAETFRAALPEGTVTLRRWCAAPDGPIAGIMFVSTSPGAAARHRIRSSTARNPDSQSRRDSMTGTRQPPRA